MALVALLSARDGARIGIAGPLLDFGGQPLVEYQARLALEAGAERLIILADTAALDLAQLIDRIAAEQQCTITLAQDMLSLSRGLVPDDDVLILAENLVLPPEAFDMLLERGPTALLILPDVPAAARFERIDPQTMWAGAMLLPAANLLATLDMLGDWDLMLTLMRRAVQAGVPRVALSPELVMDGRLTLASDQPSANLALEALSEHRYMAANKESGGLGRLLSPVSRALVRELVRRQVDPSALGIGALALAAAGLALASSAWTFAALLVMLLALSTSDLARQAALVTLRAERSAWRLRVVEGAALFVLALIGLYLAEGRLLAVAGAWMPLALIALLCFADERHPPVGERPRSLSLTTPVAVLLVLLGQLLGMATGAFALLGLLACAMMALRLLHLGERKV